MVNIRKELREAKLGTHPGLEGDSYDLSIHLLTTQNLEGSSLGESVSQFDFTSSSRVIACCKIVAFVTIKLNYFFDYFWVFLWFSDYFFSCRSKSGGNGGR